ncbi:hypothetical protein CsSME_00003572 [Camellia sinensis var. sinensis]
MATFQTKALLYLKNMTLFVGSTLSRAPVRVVIVTGSRPPQCENPIRDHLLLRLFKNKVDYYRIHGHDIFYNNAFLHRKMQSVWAKLPPVRVAIVAHPEAEWIWWLDSDAVLTDMDFKLPFEKYRDLNFIINGWDGMSCSTKRKVGWV